MAGLQGHWEELLQSIHVQFRVILFGDVHFNMACVDT